MTESKLDVARVLDELCKQKRALLRAIRPATRLALEYPDDVNAQKFLDAIDVFDRMVEEQNEKQTEAA